MFEQNPGAYTNFSELYTYTGVLWDNQTVLCDRDIAFSEHCGIAASKGNQILGLIRGNITCTNKANYTSV